MVVDPGMHAPVAPAASTKLAVVILNWNAVQDTAACLRSIRAWEAAGGVGRPTVWVVDNGSRPPGIEPIRHEFPEVHVVQSPVNRGFGGGSNLGIEAALAGGAKAILLLNNDASVDGASVAAMLETLGSDPADRRGRAHRLARGPVRLGRGTRTSRATGARISGCPSRRRGSWRSITCPAPSRWSSAQCSNAVGLLDEDYFFGGEMADLCHRARRLGFRSVTDPRARARHDLDRSPGSARPSTSTTSCGIGSCSCASTIRGSAPGSTRAGRRGPP